MERKKCKIFIQEIEGRLLPKHGLQPRRVWHGHEITGTYIHWNKSKVKKVDVQNWGREKSNFRIFCKCRKYCILVSVNKVTQNNTEEYIFSTTGPAQHVCSLTFTFPIHWDIHPAMISTGKVGTYICIISWMAYQGSWNTTLWVCHIWLCVCTGETRR